MALNTKAQQKPTSRPDREEDNWPAPVEFCAKPSAKCGLRSEREEQNRRRNRWVPTTAARPTSRSAATTMASGADQAETVRTSPSHRGNSIQENESGGDAQQKQWVHASAAVAQIGPRPEIKAIPET